MHKLFTDAQAEQIKAEYQQLREQGYSINKSIETIADKWYCSRSTVVSYVGIWL